MTILITGANSKLALPLIERLVTRYYVIATTRSPQHIIRRVEGVEYLAMDLNAPLHLDHNIDIIVHLASYVPYNTNVTDGDTFKTSYTNNVLMTQNLLRFAIENDVKKFIFASSMDVYGTTSLSLVTEETPCTPENFYGLSKITCEDMLNVYRHNHNLSFCAFRIGYVLSPHMEQERFLKRILQRLTQHEPIELFNPDHILNIVHADEVAIAIEKAIVGPNGIYNLAKPVTLGEFVDTAKKVLRSSSKITFTTQGESNRTILDNRKLTETFGPVLFGLEETIRKTVGSLS